ncbi:hypothetical protein CROQUDRAFT_53417, partial [Cronartium quercuum f. sp. fusiforme G11]
YILNSAALQSAEVCHWLTCQALPEVQPAKWCQAISVGLAIWKATGAAATADLVMQPRCTQIVLQATAVMLGPMVTEPRMKDTLFLS